MNESEFNRICGCSTANEIWSTLEVTYEGTFRVKETQIDMIVHEYELFKMEPNENISEMFSSLIS